MPMQPASGLSQGEGLLSHGYAFGITRGKRDESPCGDLWIFCLKLVTLKYGSIIISDC